MSPGLVARSIDRAAGRVPGLRRIPILKLLAIAEVGMLARDHMVRLAPAERRRLVMLVRIARGRPSTLTTAQREELSALVARLEPRILAAEAVDRLSPVPLPRRLLRGPGRPQTR